MGRGSAQRAGAALVLLGAVLAAPAPAQPVAPVDPVLRVALVLPPAGAEREALRTGALLAEEEAGRMAELLGWRLELVEVTAGAQALERSLAPLLESRSVFALVGGVDRAGCSALSALAEGAAVLFLNVGCEDDALRRERCARHTFHLAPSQAMLRDARALGADGAAAGEPVLWHPELDRYGAEQLNARFRARFAQPMTSLAWAAWMAVRVATELALRAGTTDADALARRLESTATHFDGHKGRPLSFRARDHQLRQPLYLVAPPTAGGGERVAQVPPGRPAPGQSSRDFLDQLGGRDGGAECASPSDARAHPLPR